MVPPDGDGYDWIWEDWVKEQQEKREPEIPSGGVSDGNWMEAFDQYFYGNQNEQGVCEAVDEQEGDGAQQCEMVQQECEMVSQQGQVVNQHYQVEQQQFYQTTQHHQPNWEPTQNPTDDEAYQPTPPQQTYNPTPIPAIPEYAQDLAEPIPTVSVIPPQEETINLYNTDQCIHTYNVVNTVEEVGKETKYHADPHSRRHPHPADRAHENRRRNHRVRTVLSAAADSRQRSLRQGGSSALLLVDDQKTLLVLGESPSRSSSCSTRPTKTRTSS